MSEKIKASTGSSLYDKTAEGSNDGVLEHDGRIVEIPGDARQQRIVVEGVGYTHVGDDADGRWIYRRA